MTRDTCTGDSVRPLCVLEQRTTQMVSFPRIRFPLRPPEPETRGRENSPSVTQRRQDAFRLNGRSAATNITFAVDMKSIPQGKMIFLPHHFRVSSQTALQRCHHTRPPHPSQQGVAAAAVGMQNASLPAIARPTLP